VIAGDCVSSSGSHVIRFVDIGEPLSHVILPLQSTVSHNLLPTTNGVCAFSLGTLPSTPFVPCPRPPTSDSSTKNMFSLSSSAVSVSPAIVTDGDCEGLEDAACLPACLPCPVHPRPLRRSFPVFWFCFSLQQCDLILLLLLSASSSSSSSSSSTLKRRAGINGGCLPLAVILLFSLVQQNLDVTTIH
jgi:hypothetical protein